MSRPPMSERTGALVPSRAFIPGVPVAGRRNGRVVQNGAIRRLCNFF